MYRLPSEQKALVQEAIEQFEQAGQLTISEPCNCGSHVRHNNGGNYHEIIELAKDSGQVFVKYGTTCELVPPAEWELCDDWKGVIESRADYL